MNRIRIAGSLFLASLLVTAAASGCGGDDAGTVVTVSEGDADQVRFGEGVIVVIDEAGDDFVVRGEPGDQCIQLRDTCVPLDGARGRYCDDPDANVDVVIVDDETAAGICFPAPTDADDVDEILRDEDGNVEVPRSLNGGVFTFDPDTDGEAIEGDVTLSGQRPTLYGNGIDNTIIDGDILIDANNARLRGLTVLGDVTLTGPSNNVGLSFVAIHGDLTINSNNGTFLNVTVYGDVTVNGNDNQFYGVRIGGELSGRPSVCADVRSFTFDDESREIDEVGDTIDCD